MAAPAPTTAAQRLYVLDALRGFALSGVLWANAMWWFSGLGEVGLDESSSILDAYVLFFEGVFVAGKFITIFCLLFGVGCAMLLQREGFEQIYKQRMMWLLVIGLLHAVFIWYGDILHLYALLGFILLMFRTTSPRTLIVVGVMLTISVVAVIDLVLDAAPANWHQSIDDRWDAAAATNFAFLSGSYPEIVRSNLANIAAWALTNDIVHIALQSLGCMLIGIWVVRSGWLSRVTTPGPEQREEVSSIGRMAAGWFAVAVLMSIGSYNLMGVDGFLRTTSLVLDSSSTLLLAFSYSCAFIWLYYRKPGRSLLAIFAPVGQMALTNYVAQSVICVFVFHEVGLGLYQSVGPVQITTIVFIVFAFQVIVSHWWLARYRFGPLEWVWRSLTYSQRQPMRIAGET